MEIYTVKPSERYLKILCNEWKHETVNVLKEALADVKQCPDEYRPFTKEAIERLIKEKEETR